MNTVSNLIFHCNNCDANTAFITIHESTAAAPSNRTVAAQPVVDAVPEPLNSPPVRSRRRQRSCRRTVPWPLIADAAALLRFG